MNNLNRAMHVTTHELAFGPFRLDLGRETLTRDSVELDLRPKAFAVLRYLAERPRTLVHKDQLMAGVWGKTVVTEDSITQCVVDIRKALGADYRHLVRTVPRRGFILESEVRRVDEPGTSGAQTAPAAQPGLTRSRLSLALLTGVAMLLGGMAFINLTAQRYPPTLPGAPRQVVVAVLPFADMTRQRDHTWLGDGLAEEILNQLTRYPSLDVIARTSSFALRDESLGIRELGERLGASHILEGSIRDDNESIRVTTQLIDVLSNTHLWSQTWDSQGGGSLGTQDLIARAVAEQLHGALESGFEQLPQSPFDREAWAQALQGRFYFARRGPGDLQRSLTHYTQAITLDPRSIAGWTGVSACEWMLASEAADPEPGMSRALAAASRAYELAPTDPEVLYRMARVHWSLGQAEAARSYKAMALEYGENHPLIQATRAGNAIERGEYARAVELHREALRLDPLNQLTLHNLTVALMLTGQYHEAEETALVGIDLSPGSPSFELLLAGARLGLGQPRAALEGFRHLEPGPETWIGEALALHALRDPEQARERLALVEQLGAPASELYLATYLAMTGQPDVALNRLRETFLEFAPHAGFAEQRLWTDVLHSDWLNPVRELPEWPQWWAEVADWLNRSGAATG